MVVETKSRTPEDAVEELRALCNEYRKPRGQGGLTARVIAKEIGILSTVTISLWFSGKNSPRGTTLKNLSAFLNRAKNRPWIEKLLQPKPKPKGQ